MRLNYSYQQLEEFSQLNVRQNKKNIPQWTYNVGEEVLSIQVIRTSTNFSSVVALGERHLYCFQDNGLMKFMIRFYYMPVCFHAYLIGWYYEPAARLLVMVASDDNKLYIYEGTTLLWSCDLLDQVMSVSRCFANSLPGGVVSLSINGIIRVCYLGTEPDLNSNAAPMMDAIDPRQVQDELEKVEKALQNVLDYEADTENTKIDDIIKIQANVGKPVQNLFTTSMSETGQVLHLLMCPVVLMLACEDPKVIQSIQITYDCMPPFECSEVTTCLDTINGTEIVEIQVFLSSESDISDTSINILFTVIDHHGKINVLRQNVLLPLDLYCSPATVDAGNDIQISLFASNPCALKDIFSDILSQDLSTNSSPIETVTLVYRTTNRHVTVRSQDQRYIVEASEFADVFPVLNNLITKLKEYHKKNGTGMKDFDIKFELKAESIKQIILKFLKSVEKHAKERISLLTMETELNVLQRQFTVVQQRLLVQYGSLPPADCAPLELLMRDTHRRLVATAGSVSDGREAVGRAGCTLSAIGSLVTCILRHTLKDTFTLRLVEEMLCFSSLHEHSQEWEEAITQAASYILNNVIRRSEKDKEKLATITDQDVLSQVNLKKLLRQLRIVLEHVFTGLNLDDGKDEREAKIIRVEELVEVI